VGAKRQINTPTKMHVILSVIAAIGERGMNPVRLEEVDSQALVDL